ncbi:hypothetical protein [Pararhodospirillum oryzae]|uniref:Uncharacterized protein n=1 Tax=Pararhodospirillum oryzae TaxID=478448 RepID=A0A512H900_9PROT|nr:hypothetical protein [Pararhodospirillum oryzae]GEO81937.1 hypothetical protein ROR02_20680 [Pararhodospirillum oryzae]
MTKAVDPDNPPKKDQARLLWETLTHLEQEALAVVGKDVGMLIGCARLALEQQFGGFPGQGPPPVVH